jgi:ribonuclease Z
LIKAENKSHLSEDICYYATADNHPWSYLFDCGRARYLGPGDCKSLRAIFVTHTHIDHFCNFDTLLRHHVGMRRITTVVGPKGIAKNVQGKGLSYTWNLIKRYRPVYEVREIIDQHVYIYEMGPPDWEPRLVTDYPLHDGICFREKGMTVRCVELDHKIPSMAYTMEEDSSLNIGEFTYKPGKWVKELKEAYLQNNPEVMIEISPEETVKAGDLFKLLYVRAGWKLGYAMDHLACDRNHQVMREFFKNANELVIEGFFRDCDRNYALKHFHSTAYESGHLARTAGVEKLSLVHHSRRYQSEIEDLREEGYAAFEGRTPRYKSQPISRYAEDDDSDDV